MSLFDLTPDERFQLQAIMARDGGVAGHEFLQAKKAEKIRAMFTPITFNADLKPRAPFVNQDAAFIVPAMVALEQRGLDLTLAAKADFDAWLMGSVASSKTPDLYAAARRINLSVYERGVTARAAIATAPQKSQETLSDDIVNRIRSLLETARTIILDDLPANPVPLPEALAEAIHEKRCGHMHAGKFLLVLDESSTG